MASININGNVITGSNITINGNNVFIDGECQKTEHLKEISITVTGDVESIATSTGKIDVTGNVNSVKNVSGNININGDVSGEVKNVSGNISGRIFNSSVKTISGNIKNDN